MSDTNRKALEAYQQGLRNMKQQNQNAGNVQYSLNRKRHEFSQMEYEKRVDEILAGTDTSRDMVLLGRTPKALKYLGYPDLDVFTTKVHIETMAKESGNRKGANYHGLDDLVKQLPNSANRNSLQWVMKILYMLMVGLVIAFKLMITVIM